MTTAKAPFLHVANGTSTTMTIEAAGIPGIRSIWADPLYEGPVPGGVSDAELFEVRAGFLGPIPDPDPDSGRDIRHWRRVIERHDAYRELVLWYEHDLFDQLNLIQLLAWIREHVPATTPVTLVCIGSFPGRPDFKGLGELTPGELAPLLETRQPVSDAEFALARRAWEAFREPTPEALDALRQEDTSALPFLAPALTRFLQEYPWVRDGLSRTERRLLELADGGVALRKAFPRMGEGDRFYHVTGESLIESAQALSGTSPALLTLDRPDAAGAHIVEDVVRLTDAGRAVLAGRMDRVAACGLDRWLGGVHLQSERTMWRWDEARQRVVQE